MEHAMAAAVKDRIDAALRGGSSRLDLSYCRLETVPEAVAELTHLTHLNLDGNRLDELPAWIGALSRLTVLRLFHNALTTLPGTPGALSRLTVLQLDHNALAGLPEPIGNLTRLTALYLDGNRLVSLPEPIGRLTALTALHLDGNGLARLPESLGGRPATPGSRARRSTVRAGAFPRTEDRSFGHRHGTLPGVPGLSDPHAIRLPGGDTVFHQPDPASPEGFLRPCRLDTREEVPQRRPGAVERRPPDRLPTRDSYAGLARKGVGPRRGACRPGGDAYCCPALAQAP
jgi:Leucine Rich Repeat (LRR) protein